MPTAKLGPPGLIDIETKFMEKDLVKRVPGTKWDKERLVWVATLTWATCQALRGVFGQHLEVAEDLAAWARAEYASRVHPCLTLREMNDFNGQGLINEAYTQIFPRWDDLFPFQQVTVCFMLTAGSALNATQMRLGKTIETIATMALQGQQALPGLVVAPNTMKQVWKKAFTEWAPWLRVEVVTGGLAQRRKTIDRIGEDLDVVIVGWEALRTMSRLAPYGSIALADKEKEPGPLNREWGMVVCDEAHRMKDPKSKQTRAAWAVGQTARFRMPLTGTPAANHLGDLWSLMHFVDPNEWPRRTQFIDRYCQTIPNVFGGLQIAGLNPQTEREFRLIFEPRAIRHLRAVVLPQLPEEVRQIRTVQMGTKQRKAYDSIKTRMVAELEDQTLVVTNPLAKLTRLQQFSAAHGELVNDELVLTEPSCKIDALEELAEELAGTPAIVFAESRQLIQLGERRLAKLGVPFVSIHGEVPNEQRFQNVERFQQGDIPFCLMTLGAGGEGLTLTAASVVIFLQRSGSLVKNLQAQDRILGPGQLAEKVFIIDVVTEESVEEHLHMVTYGKAERLEEVVRDRDALLRVIRGGPHEDA